MEINKKISTRLAIFGVAAILLSGSVALGAAQHRGPGNHPGRMFGRILDLTDAQKEQAKAIFEETRKANATYHEQLRALRAEERAAVKAGKSESELRNLALNGANLIANLHANRLAGEAKFWRILTPEQQAKLDAKGEQMRERMKERAERFRNREPKQ